MRTTFPTTLLSALLASALLTAAACAQSSLGGGSLGGGGTSSGGTGTGLTAQQQSQINGAVQSSTIGAASGVAPLDGNRLLPPANVPFGATAGMVGDGGALAAAAAAAAAALPKASVGAAGGAAPLDQNKFLPSANIPFGTSAGLVADGGALAAAAATASAALPKAQVGVSGGAAGYSDPRITGAAPLASPALTGNPTAPTPAALDNSGKLSTTAYSDAATAVEKNRATAAENLRAPLASPALTGAPTAPTQPAGDTSIDIATDNFVAAAVAQVQASSGGVTAQQSQQISGAAQKSNNLSDLASPSSARSNLGAMAPTDAGDNLTVLSPDGQSYAARFGVLLNGVANLAAFGALGDATSDNAAMAKAIAYAAAHAGTHILIPTGTWAFTVLSPTATGNNGGYGFELPSSTTLEGADQNATTLTWNDTNSAYLFSATSNASGGGRATNIMFRNFTVSGTWGTAVASSSTGAAAAAWDLGQAPFIPTNVDGLTFDHITSENSRGYGISARSVTDFVVSNSHTIRTFSDAINADGASVASITNNLIEHTDDDAVSIHSYLTDTWGVRRGIQITGNHIFDAQGIDVLSARQANISGNTIDTFRQACISLSTLLPSNGSVEGNSADESILVTGNECTNGIIRTHVDNVNGGLSYITINGISARAGQYAAIPGENNTATGTVQDPYPEFAANSSSTGVAVNGGHHIVISNNLLSRALPRSDGTDSRYKQWTDLGQGTITSRVGGTQNPGATGSYNVATAGLHGLTEADMQGNCFNLTGGVLRDVLIQGNHCSGQAEGLSISGTAVHYDNIVFRGNTISDYTNHGVIEGVTGKIQILVDSNLFDGDPFLKNAGHSATGTWPNGSGPVLLDKLSGSAAGIVFKNNTVKNLALLLFNNNSGQVDFLDPASGYQFDNNTIYAQPVGLGFLSGNAGVGEIRNVGFKTIWVDSNPKSSTYGTILSSPVEKAAAMPTDGSWVAGWLVGNSTPTTSSPTGWLRLTTGSGNVAGVDWLSLMNGGVDTTGIRVALTGSSYTVPSTTDFVRFTQTATISSQTIVLPTVTQDGYAVGFLNYSASGAVSALTFSPAVAGWTNASSLPANARVDAFWDATDGTWHRKL